MSASSSAPRRKASSGRPANSLQEAAGRRGDRSSSGRATRAGRASRPRPPSARGRPASGRARTGAGLLKLDAVTLGLRPTCFAMRIRITTPIIDWITISWTPATSLSTYGRKIRCHQVARLQAVELRAHEEQARHREQEDPHPQRRREHRAPRPLVDVVEPEQRRSHLVGDRERPGRRPREHVANPASRRLERRRRRGRGSGCCCCRGAGR